MCAYVALVYSLSSLDMTDADVILLSLFQENFTGAGVSRASIHYDKERVRSAAKRRLKSGRRAHFILGSQASGYNTVTSDTFRGRQREDDDVPAAGKVRERESLFYIAYSFPQPEASCVPSCRAKSGQVTSHKKARFQVDCDLL